MNYHGGDIYGIKKHIVDYSSNINPYGVPDSFKNAIINDIDCFTEYPDIEYKSLKKNICEYLEIDTDCLAVGNGAVDIIYKLVVACDCSNIVIAAPAFSEYRCAAENCNISYNEVVCYDFENECFDINKIIESVVCNSLVIVCNPNNPTGAVIDKYKLIWLCKKLKEKCSMIMVDEAFIEFTDDFYNITMLSEIDKLSNLFIVRAATKFFGMPGIRLGYGISGNREIIKKIQSISEPWIINTSAVIASYVIYKDFEYIKKSRVWINEERKSMYYGLSQIKGVHVFKSYSNFHLLNIEKSLLTSKELKQKMIEYGFLIRTGDGFEGLDNKFFRLAVKDKINNQNIIKALEDCL